MPGGARGARGEDEVQWEERVQVRRKRECRRGRNRGDTWTPSLPAPPVRPRDLGRRVKGSRAPSQRLAILRPRGEAPHPGPGRALPEGACSFSAGDMPPSCSPLRARGAQRKTPQATAEGGAGQRVGPHGTPKGGRRGGARAQRPRLRHPNRPPSARRSLRRGPPPAGDWSARARRVPIGRRSQPIA